VLKVSIFPLLLCSSDVRHLTLDIFDGHLKNIVEEEKSIPLTPLTSIEDI
jgi:hypothetical protein